MIHVPPSWSSARSVTSRQLFRFLSTPVPAPKHRPASPPTAPPPPKHKVDLRPAPIKPSRASTVSATHVPLKATLPPSNHSDTSESTHSLRDVKAAARRDIEDAEAHGVLKPPPEGANWFKSTLHKAIEIAKFYYRGTKLIFTRLKEINLIHARIKAGGSPLTRSEYRLIRTQKSDMNKVVPFLFIALLLEEIIPLIAIYAPFMLPSTCILPSQRERIDAKRADKATAFALEYRHLFNLLKQAESPPGHIPLTALKSAGASLAVCGYVTTSTACSYHISYDQQIYRILRISTVGIDSLRIRRIQNHLKFIAEDDQLLIQDRLLDHMFPKELEEALGERGM
ncbi:hypothetical protein C0992_006154 [Termitomyces sp. T32_za158]|nr:hypothetical protein C0992_006154 [Termitomyces sp. T32_za158]